MESHLRVVRGPLAIPTQSDVVLLSVLPNIYFTMLNVNGAQICCVNKRFLHVHVRPDLLDFRLHAALYLVDIRHVEDVDFEFKRLRYLHPAFVLIGALLEYDRL